jgi:hypothetical protein
MPPTALSSCPAPASRYRAPISPPPVPRRRRGPGCCGPPCWPAQVYCPEHSGLTWRRSGARCAQRAVRGRAREGEKGPKTPLHHQVGRGSWQRGSIVRRGAAAAALDRPEPVSGCLHDRIDPVPLLPLLARRCAVSLGPGALAPRLLRRSRWRLVTRVLGLGRHRPASERAFFLTRGGSRYTLPIYIVTQEPHDG